MGELIKYEFYKFFKNKKNLGIIAILFAYTIAMIGYDQIQSTKYMDEMGVHFTDKAKYSTCVSANLQFRLDENLLYDEDPQSIQESIDYFKSEGMKQQVLAFFYPKNQVKDHKYINVVMNKLYSSMLSAYDEGIIDLEEIKKRGYTLRELKILSDYTKYLIDEDIKPLLNRYQITGANGMKLFFSGSNLIVIFILISLLAADMYLKEISEGSYKQLLIQPYERKRVYLSKIITISLVSIVLIFTVALVNFTICSLIGGIGDWSYPLMSRISLNTLTLNGMEEPLLIVPLWEFVIRAFILLLPLILFNVIVIFTISILTDSNITTLGLTVIIVLISFSFNAFLEKTSAINLWYPYSYLFIEDVFEVSNRSNYLMGLILCSLGGILSFVVGYIKFVKKDFLGVVD